MPFRFISRASGKSTSAPRFITCSRAPTSAGATALSAAVATLGRGFNGREILMITVAIAEKEKLFHPRPLLQTERGVAEKFTGNTDERVVIFPRRTHRRNWPLVRGRRRPTTQSEFSFSTGTTGPDSWTMLVVRSPDAIRAAFSHCSLGRILDARSESRGSSA